MTVRRVRVGDVLELQRRSVTVDPAGEYREIGVRSFGKGIFHKEPILGAELGAKRVFRIEPGDLVLSNVFAWEGAIAVATDQDAGRIGSHRFMTFTAKTDDIDLRWAHWFFFSEPGLDLIRSASPGSAGRNKTLAIDRFENLKIPLPPVDEQRLVAGRLKGLARSVKALLALCDRSAGLALAYEDSTVARVIEGGAAAGWEMRRLAEVADINPRTERPRPEDEVTFVPMAAVDNVTGSIIAGETRKAGDLSQGYKHFVEGDVIFARITPCMQNGKSAIFRGPHAHAFGSTEFHVIRPGQDVTSEWIHRILRTTGFRANAKRSFTGTAGQQRVPASFLQKVEVPVPSTIAEQRRVCDVLDEVDASARASEQLRSSRELIVKALLPAALNREFAGLI